MSENTVENQIHRIEELSDIFENLLKHFQSLANHDVSNEVIFNALYLQLDNKMKFECPVDLWDVDINFEDACQLLHDFDFTILEKTIETPVDWTPRVLLIQRKARFKHQGQIWVIHKYDQDPFASSPHAHDIDNGLKVDLSNGKCYRIREHIHTITKKQLLQIREKAQQIFSGELPTLQLN
jgi:hypothetical protein